MQTATRVPYIEIEDPLSDAWKLGPAIDILRDGGLGVIPTDTCYMFVTAVDSRKGVERIYTIKEVESYKTKPLTLLCKDISQISTYTTATNFKSTFKMLKALLPGPYTFIFAATNDLPRMVLEHKNRSAKTWKRRQIGIRIPSDDVCREIIEELGKPLLCAGDMQTNAIARTEHTHTHTHTHTTLHPTLTHGRVQVCRDTTTTTAQPWGLQTCTASSSTSWWMRVRASRYSPQWWIGRLRNRAC